MIKYRRDRVGGNGSDRTAADVDGFDPHEHIGDYQLTHRADGQIFDRKHLLIHPLQDACQRLQGG